MADTIRHLPVHVGVITLAQGVTYVGCGKILSSRSLQRLRRRYKGRLPKDTESKLEEAARLVMNFLMRGQIAAFGNYQLEDNPPSIIPEPIPLEFLKDDAWADPYTDTISTDWTVPNHFAGSLRRYKYVRLDRDAFFRAIEAPAEGLTALSDQHQEVERKLKRSRTQSKEDDARLRNRIQSVLAAAKRIDPEHRGPIRALAIKLAHNRTTSQGYKVDTIRQILNGTYRPMKRLEMRGLY